MAIRQDTRRISSGPIVLLIAFLSVFAMGLTGFYVLTSGRPPHPVSVTTSSFPGPDAVERNQQLQLAREKNPEATHGH